MVGGKVALLALVALGAVALASSSGNASPKPKPNPGPAPVPPHPVAHPSDVPSAARQLAAAVRAYGWQGATAECVYFQHLFNAAVAAQSSDPNFTGPPEATLVEDGKYGPNTRQAVIESGVANPPAAFFTKG